MCCSVAGEIMDGPVPSHLNISWKNQSSTEKLDLRAIVRGEVGPAKPVLVGLHSAT
jgi:hypothetical protein